MPSTKLPTKVAKSGPDPLKTPNARAKAPVAATCTAHICLGRAIPLCHFND